MAHAIAPSDEDVAAAELMIRLQSQFGDLDLEALLPSDDNGEEKKDDHSTCSDESSLDEPTAEELLAWQQAQYEKGQRELARKRHAKLSPIQRRRELREKQKKTTFFNNEADDDDWEKLDPHPDLDGQTSAFFPTSDEKGHEFLGVHPMLQQLQSGDPEVLGTKWLRLYSSSEGDGLSFFHLLDTLNGYPGPTILFIGGVPSANRSLKENPHSKKATQGDDSCNLKRQFSLGFYTASPWTQSFDFFGSNDCFLFALDEKESQVHFFHPRQGKGTEKTQFMYCRPSTMSVVKSQQGGKSTKKGSDGSVYGIGMGGTSSQPRLHLTENLEECRAMEYCTSFESGDLLLGEGSESLNYFDVECLEVWAVGGKEWIQESLAERQKERELKEANLQRARKVDKRQLMEDLKMGFLNPHKTTTLFQHVEHTVGRCDL